MRTPALFFLLLILLFVFALLPSCGVPFKASVATDYGSLGYSSKSGLDVQVDQRSRK